MRRLLPCLFLLAAPAQAQSEKLAAGARRSFQLASYTGFALVGLDKGAAGGADLDFAPNKAGGSVVVGVSGFGRTVELGRSDFRPDGKAGRVDVKAFSGGPTIGYRQRLGKLGLGRASLTPNVALGWAPLSVSKIGYLRLEDDGKYEHVNEQGGWAPWTFYAAAGVDVSWTKRFAIGVQARQYQELAGNGLSAPLLGASFTYFPR